MSGKADHFSGERGRIERAAADWIALRYAGLNDRQQADFLQWLDSDPRHAAVFAELDETWRMLDEVRKTPFQKSNSETPDANLPAPRRGRPGAGRRHWLMASSLTAAAALALAYLGSVSRSPRLEFSEQITTRVGNWQNLDLPDGSRVRLNTDSRLEVAYSAAERRVRLARGEACFSVAKNPTRPFLVEAGAVAVRAVGTTFNVRLDAEAVEVLVTEGKVRVDDRERGESVLAVQEPAREPLLIAGQKAVIPAVDPAEKRPPVLAADVAPVEIERVLSWRDRRLEFVAAPLREIVEQFNRCNRHQLVLADAALAERRLGGSFRADEPETFVRLLKARFGLIVEAGRDETILREPSP